MPKHATFIALIVMIAAPASASKQRQESCAITADIVSQAVEARLGGKSPDQTKTDLASDGSGITGIYKATIPALVDMVFGFEESTLGQGVVQDYETQCLNF
ncbi:MAG: hypothetical protein AAF382_15140 [Pseudomonadota bacterium]